MMLTSPSLMDGRGRCGCSDDSMSDILWIGDGRGLYFSNMLQEMFGWHT